MSVSWTTRPTSPLAKTQTGRFSTAKTLRFVLCTLSPGRVGGLRDARNPSSQLGKFAAVVYHHHPASCRRPLAEEARLIPAGAGPCARSNLRLICNRLVAYSMASRRPVGSLPPVVLQTRAATFPPTEAGRPGSAPSPAAFFTVPSPTRACRWRSSRRASALHQARRSRAQRMSREGCTRP